MDIKKCVAIYEQLVSEKLVNIEAEKVLRQAEEKAKTLVLFQELELEPKRVEGMSAFFQYDGSEIQLVRVEWRYGANAFCRVLGKCEKCGELLATDESYLTPENIGRVISNPEARYHDCPNWNSASTELPVENKSARERLMDMLDEYIQTVAVSEGAKL